MLLISMEDPSRTVASRKAEEAALRRFQAAVWLESFVGPLGLENQPSEREFVSCLRNGFVLCKVINKIQPGSVSKVIESNSQSVNSETQQLNAYQYFENIRNFLVAVEELNLPAFEASDLERDSLEAGSAAKIVDCILSLKSYHEWKEWSAGVNGSSKHVRSPMLPRSNGRVTSNVAPANSSGLCRQLDMPTLTDKTVSVQDEGGKLEDSVVEALIECMLGTKENIDHNLLASLRHGNMDSTKVFNELMSRCLHEQRLNQPPELKGIHEEPMVEEKEPEFVLTENSSRHGNEKSCKFCLKKPYCKHWRSVEIQEKDLADLKVLLSKTKHEFEILQSQMQSDLQQLGSKVQELSFAALGYQKVMKENRDLYNMVQDLKGNIRVYCRIRPLFGSDKINAIDHIGADGSLVVLDPLKLPKDARKVFHFNQVFGPTATQEEVFKDTKPLIRSVMDGYNVCIFAYGQTGSGKTHTMCGPSVGSATDMGINYLALNDLFQISCARKDVVNYDFRVQMVEIYNEQVRDLLTEDASTTKLEIRSCTSNGGLSLPDATMHTVNCSLDVLNIMKLGELNRVVSSTAMNNRSSRSHSILTVHVQGKDISGNILRSCLHLVDLAGSERVDKSEVTGDRLKEAQYINKSLSCLGDVIMALAQKNSHIPYRNSKLTQLLQDSLGGHAKTLMFAHVSPESDSYGETVSTLKFAQRVSTVELGAARVNKESSEVNELKEQVERLKKALSSKEAQSFQLNRANELISLGEKPKPVTERTPPRIRQPSIESLSLLGTTESLQPNKAKEVRSPREKSKLMNDRTPPRLRRLSIESCAVSRTSDTSRTKKTKEITSPQGKTKVTTEQTPASSRRLSIESSTILKSAGSLQPNKIKELRSPREKAKPMAERTPPRPRRLSIENSSVPKTEKVANADNRKNSRVPASTEKYRTERTPTRTRRLSLESPKYGKDQLHVRSSTIGSRNGVNGVEVHHSISTPSQQICGKGNNDYCQSQDAEASISSGNCNDSGPLSAISYQSALRSPISSVFQSRRAGMESKRRVQPVQPPQTPEHPTLVKKEDQIVTPCDLEHSLKSKTLGIASKKGSQLKKSLQSIGKLINMSDRRHHQYSAVPKSPIRETKTTSDKSPLTVDSRTLRRQSLTGVHTSRRSSLGGKSTDKYPRTPPPVHPSSSVSVAWF